MEEWDFTMYDMMETKGSIKVPEPMKIKGNEIRKANF